MTAKQPSPEEMTAFFNRRADGYDDHMRSALGETFAGFYRAVAAPVAETALPVAILDLGCGTGAEVAELLKQAANARFTCIDLSREMLDRLVQRYAAHQEQLQVIQGSYLDLAFPEATYDYAVSVMTAHHFLPEPKRALYAKIHRSLKPAGIYVEGDWYVTPAAEQEGLRTYAERMQQAGSGLYHIDIPFTIETQRRLLLEAGFAAVDVAWSAGHDAVIVARR